MQKYYYFPAISREYWYPNGARHKPYSTAKGTARRTSSLFMTIEAALHALRVETDPFILALNIKNYRIGRWRRIEYTYEAECIGYISFKRACILAEREVAE